jgi:hypothetical protein
MSMRVSSFSSLNRATASAFASSVFLDAGAAAADGRRHRVDGLVLADHAPLQLRFELQQPRALAREHLRDGDARPTRHDVRDVLLGHLLLEVRRLLLHLTQL